MFATIKAVNIMYEIMFWLIMARVLMSWLPINKSGPLGEFLYTVTEPILHPARAILFMVFPKMKYTGLDLSPILGLLLLQLLRRAIIYLIISI